MKILGTQVLICLLVTGFAVAGGKRSKLHEQTSFSAEDESVERAVQMPDKVKVVLARDPVVATILEDQNLRAEELPASWFNVAEIHLSSPSRKDLIVIAQPPVSGANTTFFWIFLNRNNPALVLDTQAHTLHVSTARWKGLREIQTSWVALQQVHSRSFRFDGKRYTQHRITSEKIE